MDVTNTTSLDQIHNLFIDKIKHEKGILWKLGVYSKIVKNYKALEQGKLIEEFFRELMNATDLDTDEKSVSVTGTNGDYRVNSGIDVNVNALKKSFSDVLHITIYETLFSHLYYVSMFSVNKMNSTNIGTVYAPNLFKKA